MNSNTINRIQSNDHRYISRIISKIESDQSFDDESFFDFIYSSKNYHKALRLGITGPPGAGKSTLIDKLIAQILNDNKSVGVVAIDPSSPFSGGALLGDRVRMNNYLWNENVFVRSMGSQGKVGGLAKKTQDIGDLLAASGKDVIIYETVGVGQGEYEVAKAADITLVVLVPESGDEVQLMKAGLIEIADIFVVNKSDRNGSKKLALSLENILKTFKSRNDIQPLIFNTSANINKGIEELYNGLNKLFKSLASNGYLDNKRLIRYKNRVNLLVQDSLMQKFWTHEKVKLFENLIDKIVSTNESPHKVARDLLSNKK